MSADIDIPQEYWIHHLNLSELELDAMKLTLALPPVIKVGATEFPATPLKVDAGLDNIRIKELPKIEVEAGLKPTRVHLPVNYHVCFSIFGLNVASVSLCGEGMAITEPYVPHESEKCD